MRVDTIVKDPSYQQHRVVALGPRKARHKSSLVYTPTIHKIRRRALRALFSDKSLQIRGLFLVNKSKEASTCRRECNSEAAALLVVVVVVGTRSRSRSRSY